MSASLVGSEMCIRDSYSTYRGSARVCSPSRGGHGAGRHKRYHYQQNYPVSYTHLTLPTICSV
eukprot:3048126-Alexandrium_andersonii.AAC.1